MRLLLLVIALVGSTVQASPLRFEMPDVAESPREQETNLSRNARALGQLQKAAKECVAMRLVMAESAEVRLRRPVEMARLSATEMEQMRGVIARMQAVKTAPAGAFGEVPHAVRLELLGQNEQVLGKVSYLDAISENLVDSRGYAAGSRFMLRGNDSAAWHLLLRASEARAIARNPAPTRQSSRAPRLHKRPEPPAPTTTTLDVTPDEPYYHTNCTRHHKGHKHKGKNHYCTHPQH